LHFSLTVNLDILGEVPGKKKRFQNGRPSKKRLHGATVLRDLGIEKNTVSFLKEN